MNHIVFLPGLGCDETLFSHQEKNLQKEYITKTLVCNTKDRMADHVKFVLDNSPDKFILVGHSFGGWIAQWVAIDAPERISHLVLMGTGSGNLTVELKSFFTEMKMYFERDQAADFFDKINSLIIHENRKNDTVLHQLIKKMQSFFSKENLLNQVNTDLEAKDTSGWLKEIQIKTLLIHGKQDAFYENEMLHFKKEIPNNHFIEIEDCGHMIPIEQPEAVTYIICKNSYLI